MPNKKLLLIVIVIIIVGTVFWWLFSNRSKSSPPFNPIAQSSDIQKKAPSETLIEYVDPAGFSFNYPDNLSLNKNDIEDNTTYVDLQLNSNHVSGSLSLKITDSKYKTLDEWVNLNKAAVTEEPKEVMLGTLKAKELKTSDRLLLGALDQGILFTIELPRIEEEFWTKVYSKILADFSFAVPETNTSDVSSNDVVFEGEEVVE